MNDFFPGQQVFWCIDDYILREGDELDYKDQYQNDPDHDVEAIVICNTSQCVRIAMYNLQDQALQHEIVPPKYLRSRSISYPVDHLWAKGGAA